MTDDDGETICDDCGDPYEVQLYVHDGESYEFCAACAHLESNFHITGGGIMQTKENMFTAVKVFSATKHVERVVLGETVTDWLRSRPNIEVVDKIVTQSSDAEFHCLAITLFYRETDEIDRAQRKGKLVGRAVPGER